jgi:hypothetical protein
MPHHFNNSLACTLLVAVAAPGLGVAILAAQPEAGASGTPSSVGASTVSAPVSDSDGDNPDADVLSTPDIIPPPVAPVTSELAPELPPQVEEEPDQAVIDAAKERQRLRSLAEAAYTGAAQTDLATSPVSDVPSLMAPFSEISSFSLGHTVPGSKWRLFPHFSVSGIFDDNIYLSSDDKVSDFYFALSPGLGAVYGTDDSPLKIRFDYTASFLVFMKESSQDTVDQNAAMRISYALPKLTLGLNLGFQSLNGASIDVGDRVRRQIYYVGITSNYVLDEKFSVDLNADETIADYHGLYDSNESRVQTFLNYQATGKLNIGVGATFGYLDVQSGPGQTYEQLLGRLTYDATGKLVLFANGGVEYRQSDIDTVSPVFSIGAAYSPTATTTITADIHERVYGSAAIEGADYRAIGFLVSVTQQLRYDLSGILSVGYENAAYFAVEKGVIADRTDHFVYTRVGPDWQVRPWWHLGAFYEFSRNASSGYDSRPFTRNRVGIQANFAF